MDVITWAALGSAILVGLALLKLWMDFYREINAAKELAAKAEAAAAEASKDIEENKRDTASVQQSLTVANASFSLYRETQAQQAGQFITRDMLREMEQRLTTSANDKFVHLTAQIDGLTERFDRFMLNMARPEQPEPPPRRRSTR